MKRLMMFGMVTATLWMAENWLLSTQQADLSARLALNQFNGGNSAARELRSFQSLKDSVQLATALLTLVAAVFTLGPVARKFADRISASPLGARLRKVFGSTASVIVAVTALGFTSGCIKAYDKPEYVEIDTSETGFLIPLEGDGTQQAKFQSEEYLKQRKVAAKRVQITHRWSQEGRISNDGRWIATVRLVKVNRSPVTREWMSTATTNGEGNRRPTHTDQAIWIESGDSVGFSMGFTCTAFISEDDAAKFLYWYPSGSLHEVMDREVRARIQQVSAEVAAKYPLDVLRSKKQEISDAVKHDLTNFFATRGITVTTVGMFGGMTYENPAIQRSIDDTFIAQQLKVVSEAKFEAQKKENERIELEANAVAEKARREAMGLADARKTAAAGEAEAIREVNRALNEAQQNPLLYQLKALDVEKARVEKWDGRYPQWWMAGNNASGGPNLLFQVPTPVVPKN
ncbi:MAG: hypothetical protein EPO07_06975 [Verrucomicrobia bacterium]|nr:MAG: hypothetical protein EPO07_06975 [Verrucomicrobiota bacterium]